MKRRYLILILSVLLVAILVTAVLLTPKADEGFSCHTYDDRGQILRAHCSQTDGVWYLFVTSTQDVAEIQLHCAGQVARTSAGVLDQNTVSGAFRTSGDRVVLTLADGTTRTVAVLQSSLPSVYVALGRTTLESIHADKDVKYKNNSVYIMDPESTGDLAAVGSVTIKGRGNSSWQAFEKKSYQIEFESETAVLGMAPAAKWVLLANASDDSMMRNQLVSAMAARFDMSFAVSFEYVDLWVDGEYLGTYLLGEKAELGPSRLDLQTASAALFEHDVDFYQDEEYWFRSKTLDRPFTLKEIAAEKHGRILDAMADFEAAVDELMQYLYSTPSEAVTLAELSQMIDVDSFIKYYLINEYALNRESFSTSFYWYQDGPQDVLHLGPVWDFDTCMGNDGEPYTAQYGTNHVMFRHLLASPAVYGRTMELLEAHRDDLKSMTEAVEVLRAQIGQSAKMNYLRWPVLGKPNPKGGADFAPTFDAAADTLKQWLRGREGSFRVEPQKIATGVVSEDGRWLTVRCLPEAEYNVVKVALWSQENDRDDEAWYQAAKAADGSWQCTVDLERHNSAGIYYYHVYADDQKSPLAIGRNYVHTAWAPPQELHAELEASTAELVIQLSDRSKTLTSVRFDIWAASARDTTFHRVQAQKDWRGDWTLRLNACGFNLSGPDTLMIQAYGTDQAGERKLDERMLSVETAYPHTYPGGEGSACVVCGDISGVEEYLAKTPVYYLRAPHDGEHFYTVNATERDHLISSRWQDGGIAWYAPVFSGEQVYRFFKQSSTVHAYAMDPVEIAGLEGSGWALEGMGWKSYAGGVPVYRMHDPSSALGSRLYTASEAERDALTAAGWICEGIAWYAVPGT